jgi:hypothetical protein
MEKAGMGGCAADLTFVGLAAVVVAQLAVDKL